MQLDQVNTKDQQKGGRAGKCPALWGQVRWGKCMRIKLHVDSCEEESGGWWAGNIYCPLSTFSNKKKVSTTTQ